MRTSGLLTAVLSIFSCLPAFASQSIGSLVCSYDVIFNCDIDGTREILAARHLSCGSGRVDIYEYNLEGRPMFTSVIHNNAPGKRSANEYICGDEFNEKSTAACLKPRIPVKASMTLPDPRCKIK